MFLLQLPKPSKLANLKPAFTLIELLVTISVFTTLTAFISINLIRPQQTSSVDTQIQTLIADIKSQQLKTMQGDTSGQSAAQKHGVYISANKYTLFSGNNYNPLDGNNFEVALDGDLQLTTTFASSTLLFENMNGQVSTYTAGQDTITLTSPSGSLNKTITINPLGTISVN